MEHAYAFPVLSLHFAQLKCYQMRERSFPLAGEQVEQVDEERAACTCHSGCSSIHILASLPHTAKVQRASAEARIVPPSISAYGVTGRNSLFTSVA